MSKKYITVGLLAGLTAGTGAGLILQQTGSAGASSAVVAAQPVDDETTTTTSTEPDRRPTMRRTPTRSAWTAAARLAEVLAPLVADGTLTQAQADAVVAALEAAGPIGGHGHGRHGGRGAHLETVAEVLGITVDELRTQLRAAARSPTIAGDQTQAVIDALVVEATARIEQGVTDGRLTREEADEKLAELSPRRSPSGSTRRPPVRASVAVRAMRRPTTRRRDRRLSTPERNSRSGRSPSDRMRLVTMVAMSGKVLVVDDDRAIRESLARALELDGYEVALVSDGAAALATIRASRPDVAIVDVMMPNIDGLTLCRVLRAEKDRLPILMLTARTETSDRVAGLDAGADDYLPKPFELRRAAGADPCAAAPQPGRTSRSTATALQVGDLRVDPEARRVWRGGEEIELSKTEFDLLELLVRNAGIVLDHTVDLRADLELRLRTGLEEPRRVHQLPAPQDRHRRRPEADPHGARRRLHGRAS